MEFSKDEIGFFKNDGNIVEYDDDTILGQYQMQQAARGRGAAVMQMPGAQGAVPSARQAVSPVPTQNPPQSNTAPVAARQSPARRRVAAPSEPPGIVARPTPVKRPATTGREAERQLAVRTAQAQAVIPPTPGGSVVRDPSTWTPEEQAAVQRAAAGPAYATTAPVEEKSRAETLYASYKNRYWYALLDNVYAAVRPYADTDEGAMNATYAVVGLGALAMGGLLVGAVYSATR